MIESIKNFFKQIDRKTLLYLGIGIGVIVLLIIILAVLSKLSVKETYDYGEVEEMLVESAKKYYEENPVFLPTTEKGTSTVNDKTLVKYNYIKPLDELIDGSVCSADVVVTKIKNEYEYFPYLNCGDAYSVKELYKKVLEDNLTAESGAGIYSIKNEHVFRGEVKNNYISLNENLWRIMRIDEDNNLVLISDFKTDTYEWDDRYNSEVDGQYGINDYNVSRIKDYLNDLYYNGELLQDSEKAKVVSKKACISNQTTVTSECEKYSDEESIRLITIPEYLISSIDEKCVDVDSKNCINYNYLNEFTSSYWTMTPGKKDSSYAYNISSNGVAESRTSNSRQGRYVILLGTKALYKSGSGLKTDPYIIK